MSTSPFYVITHSEKRLTILSFAKPYTALLTIVFLSACTTPIKQEPVVDSSPARPAVVERRVYSNEPIIQAQAFDIRFAQYALTKIGYKIGQIDGLWGPRSANAIRQFELEKKLPTANGHLSELNLHELEVSSGILREGFDELVFPSSTSPVGISAKLKNEPPLTEGPQLIIVDREYKVLSKPNPYSSQLLTLAAGTGIYVISKQDGYFEIESINRKRGFIRVD